MSNVMGIYVKFTTTTHQIWSCLVTLASNSEKFYFLPNSMLNFKKVTKFERNWLKNKKSYRQKTNWGVEKTPSRAYRVKLFHYIISSLCREFPAYDYNNIL